MTGEAKEFLEVIGLEINKEKSATNDTCCEDTATLLEGVSVYKYLGIIEDSRGIPTLERLCHTRLNAKNLFSAINQHAISLINYDIGVLRLEPADFSKLDDAVRAVLVKNKIHLCPGCKERLYLPRTELGRGLHSVELRSEHMLLQLDDCMEKSKAISTRRAAIFKYRLVEEVTKKSLEEAQLAKLYNEIEKRKLHSKLYNARKNELVSVSDSSRPRNEALFCYIQDRNVFWGADCVCQRCNKSGKTVDHLATRCEKMLGHDYTRRHNEVVRCLYLLFLNRYKFNVEIIPYVMTWGGIVTKYHKSHLKRLEIPMNVEAYIQSIVLKKTSWERASMGVIMRSEMHGEPTLSLKEAKRKEDESDLKEETVVVKEVEENI
ncbi:hypothetical protein CWI38_0538p0010 [Hamiltosporidium tvaerminnensis]|uniref:Reverse transcriptase n=1 Tax=Hamiltosporidium tvaerminnensis TaxID=1176355 RepID=A0A4Q9LZ90_9MICR|nr:hypothetical protein CWI38_0539p0030 [Hamiltosporidium tvaerminnensis]TBU13075.1 hypothetical protein CWI38_0538p0010 [Hamiltosporidium tvaerminnensis]